MSPSILAISEIAFDLFSLSRSHTQSPQAIPETSFPVILLTPPSQCWVDTRGILYFPSATAVKDVFSILKVHHVSPLSSLPPPHTMSVVEFEAGHVYNRNPCSSHPLTYPMSCLLNHLA